MPAAQTTRRARAARPVALLLCVLLAGTALAAVFAPYLYAELLPYFAHEERVAAAAPPLAKGRMLDDYFAVQDLGENTFAIGEPRYWQQNYAYLILGTSRALLFDAGSGTRDLSTVIARLTNLPVTVAVSHLHYDHLGGIVPFKALTLIDLPATRARVSGGRLRPGRYDYAGLLENRVPPLITVAGWLEPRQQIDLGGRVLTVLATPGHTASSMALFDARSHRLFIGDFIYPTTLYAFLPGASLAAYRATSQRLLDTLPEDTVLWTAHCCRAGEGVQAPWLAMSDLRDLNRTLLRVARGDLAPRGFFPRVYPVNAQMTLATAFPWNNR
jgi:hydroxyacylglutathione hydrolase